MFQTVFKNATNFSPFQRTKKNRGFYLGLNAEDTSSSIKNDNTFYPFDYFAHVKSRDDSECRSSLDENDSTRVWKGLKINNYMFSPRGVVPMPIPMPKTRGRKKHDDVMNKMIQLARKEQVDRFAKVSASSGLLNGLNPGIINNVRNSKQALSIIEALVRSESTEKKRGRGERTETEGPLDIHTSCIKILELRSRDCDSYTEEKMIYGRMPLQCSIRNKDINDELKLKLSSSHVVASENTSCLSNEESENLTSVTSLSFKAANVALQWLELLNQDIRGRLAALRHSKKRVRAVITKELPLLKSKEFLPNHADKASVDAHAVRWSSIFGRMDKSLSEEETNLIMGSS